jgi:hypothetical protein
MGHYEQSPVDYIKNSLTRYNITILGVEMKNNQPVEFDLRHF